MSPGWRRMNEMVLQKWRLPGAKFLPTSNKRCEMMFQEAASFASHLKKLEMNIRRLQRDIESMALDTRNIMLYSLPRTYNFTPSGQAVPDEPDPVLIGQNVLLDRLTVAIHTLKQRMQQDVFVPLTSWITAFTKVQSRMKKLEGIRLELDSRRRTVDILCDKAEKQKSTIPSGGDRAQIHHDGTVRRMHHKEKKQNETLTSFQEHESQVYDALFSLVSDTACFRDYTALAYNILEETFRIAYSSFEGGNNGSIVAYIQSPPSAQIPPRGTSSISKSTKGWGVSSLLRGGRKTDSANTDEEVYFYNNGHDGSTFGFGEAHSTGTGDETQTDIISGQGAAFRYGSKRAAY